MSNATGAISPFAFASNQTFGPDYEQDLIELGHRPAVVFLMDKTLPGWALESTLSGAAFLIGIKS